jgi:hypothetical protein
MTAYERAHASERMLVGVGAGLSDGGRERGIFRVDKFDIDQIDWAKKKFDLDVPEWWEPKGQQFTKFGLKPQEVYEKDNCNLLTGAGWAIALNSKSFLASGSNTTVWWTAAVGRIGLGTSGTTPTYADSALNAIGALTTANWELVSSVPTYTAASGGTGPYFTLAATFPLNAANTVAITEFGTDQGNAATLSTAAVGVFVTHGLASPGTKTSSQVWNVTVTIQFT